NSSGNIIQHYVYSSFGKILKIMNGLVDNTASPLIKTNFAYTNREYDSEIGLYYYRARYYAPDLGRFLTEDPHPGFISVPGTINSAYAYVLNNPTNSSDPQGKIAPIVVAMVIGAVIGGIKHYNNHGLSLNLSSLGSLVGSMAIGAAIGAGAYYLGTLGANWGAGNLALGGSKTLGAFLGSFAAGFTFSVGEQVLTKGKVNFGNAMITGFFFGVGGAIGQGAKQFGVGSGAENLDAINKGASGEFVNQVDLGPTIKIPGLH
ncbi:MAG: RHS repeat domain-containing protein, partial [Bacteriovoracaceae bacterium]